MMNPQLNPPPPKPAGTLYSNLPSGSDPMSHYQSVEKPVKPKNNPVPGFCGCLGIAGLAAVLLIAAYFLFPGRTRLLLLGIDRAPNGTAVSRTDTIILLQVNPPGASAKMLSIPRDLWVPIPGVGENRINTAHFYAEAQQAGSGPAAIRATIAQNFGVRPDYYARIQFDGFEQMIDAMGGLDLNLPKPMGGLDAGQHHLSGAEALAFARDRKGSDDFFRMNQGQVVIRAAITQVLLPSSWKHIPTLILTLRQVLDTDLPIWLFPRVGFALLRASIAGFDAQTLTREMATPFTTSGGAQVLMPNWTLIHPLIQEMFGP